MCRSDLVTSRIARPARPLPDLCPTYLSQSGKGIARPARPFLMRTRNRKTFNCLYMFKNRLGRLGRLGNAGKLLSLSLPDLSNLGRAGQAASSNLNETNKKRYSQVSFIAGNSDRVSLEYFKFRFWFQWFRIDGEVFR